MIFEGIQKGVGFPLRPLFKSNLFGQIGTDSILTCFVLVSTHLFYMQKHNEISIVPLNVHDIIINIIKKRQGISLLMKIINLIKTIEMFKFGLFCHAFQGNLCRRRGP